MTASDEVATKVSFPFCGNAWGALPKALDG